MTSLLTFLDHPVMRYPFTDWLSEWLPWLTQSTARRTPGAFYGTLNLFFWEDYGMTCPAMQWTCFSLRPWCYVIFLLTRFVGTRDLGHWEWDRQSHRFAKLCNTDPQYSRPYIRQSTASWPSTRAKSRSIKYNILNNKQKFLLFKTCIACVIGLLTGAYCVLCTAAARGTPPHE